MVQSNKKIRKAILPVGGLGTRLKKISNGRPKSLMPLGKRVFIDFLIE